MDKNFLEVVKELENNYSLSLKILAVWQEKESANKNVRVRNHWKLKLIISQNEDKEYVINFNTGMNFDHKPNVYKERGLWRNKNVSGAVYTDEEALKFGLIKLKEPKLAEVLECLLSDADCGHSNTFKRFCSDLGYDLDSRKALETYLQCQDTYEALHSFFGAELYSELQLSEK